MTEAEGLEKAFCPYEPGARCFPGPDVLSFPVSYPPSCMGAVPPGMEMWYLEPHLYIYGQSPTV